MYGTGGIFKPLVKTHKDALKHRFYTFAHIAFILVIYELTLGIGSITHPDFPDYIREKVWYHFFDYLFPGATLILSIALIANASFYLIHDWFGIRTPKEEKEKEAKKKNLIGEGKMPEIKPKESFSKKFKWYLWGTVIVEGFLLGSIIYAILPLFTQLLTLLLFQQVELPPAENEYESLRSFHTNVLIQIGLAFGTGFYEEYIFRFLLILLLSNLNPLTKPIPYLPTAKPLSKPIIVLFASLLYAGSHFLIPGGENFYIYIFLYRFFFSIVLYQIIKRFRLPLAVWTHIFYNIWYYILL